MKNIIKVEIKRILTKEILLFFTIFILIFSVYSSINIKNSYDLYDASGKVIVQNHENLKESKKLEHNILLDYKNLTKIINREDTSKYTYNTNLVNIVLLIFQDKKFNEITENDLHNFYEQRIKNLITPIDLQLFSNKKSMLSHLNKEKQQWVVDRASELKQPLEIGYAEGWYNLNNSMVDITTILLLFLSVISLTLFGESQKGSMYDLLISTKNGKKYLIISKLITIFLITLIIYFIGLFIYTICILFNLGFEGYNLYIQSHTNYLYSSYNITFLVQYLMNLFMGFISTLSLVYGIVLFTAIFRKIMSSLIITVFLWLFMISLPNNMFNGYNITHYLTSFFPYNSVNFYKYYIYNDVYNLNGTMFLSYYFVLFILFMSTIMLIFISYIISIKYLEKAIN